MQKYPIFAGKAIFFGKNVKKEQIFLAAYKKMPTFVQSF